MFKRLTIPDVFVFKPKRFEDDRGFLVETYSRELLETMTGPINWVQDNQSLSHRKGTVRALHFQAPPFAQDKLVRCVRGAIMDVALDIRHGSPTFGQHVAAKLTSDSGEQIFVPKGFAHGFATLEDDCEVVYKVSDTYNAAHDRNIRWNDPSLRIDWGIDELAAILSLKDAVAPMLSDTPKYFRYEASV
ncbi:MAG: dTDP-4-dehydrorhamnose 3,5-epimerase [Burkholderiales bacterium]|nr:MAG: dTDP-4-dehydrorhamnose 3,5-epimerase [Burkholderiales bacterium]